MEYVRENNPPLGILMMVGFCVMAPLSEAFVKLIGDALPLLMVVFARFLAQTLLFRRRLWTDRHTTWATRQRLPLIVLRAVLHLVAIACFFLALRYLPLADALAIAYVMPFMILGVGFLLGERARPVQLGLCLIGFIGTLMVVQPSFANVGWPALLPLIVATLFTGFVFITRQIAHVINPIELQAVNGIIAVAIMVPLFFVGHGMGFTEMQLAMPTGTHLIYLFALGVLGTIGHLMMTWALKLTSPTTVAPVQYLEIAFGALFGFLVFQDLPNGLAALGILIVIGAGLAVLATNRRLA